MRKRKGFQFVIVAPEWGQHPWISMRTILPSLALMWAEHLRAEGGVGSIRQLGKGTTKGVLLEAAQADVLVALKVEGGVLLLLHALRRAMGVSTRFIIHEHGEGTGTYENFSSPEPWMSKDDILVSASVASARSLRARKITNPVFVLPFPVLNFSMRLPSPRQRQVQTRFVYAGRLTAPKNLHVLLWAYALARASGPASESVLEIYANAPASDTYCKSLKDFVKKLGLASAVRWMGAVSQAELIKAFAKPGTCFVSASLHKDENFGVAAVLALAYGARAVLSAWGGHRDLLSRCPSQALGVPVESYRGCEPVLPVAALSQALNSACLVKAPGIKAQEQVWQYYGSPDRSILCKILKLQRKSSRIKSASWLVPLPMPKAQELFKAYGAQKKSLTAQPESTCCLLPPWAKIAPLGRARRLELSDPLRGRICIKLQKKIKNHKEQSLILDGERLRQSVLIGRDALNVLRCSGNCVLLGHNESALYEKEKNSSQSKAKNEKKRKTC